MATAQDVIDEFRRRAVDTAEPYLWTPEEVLVYVDKAHTDFIRAIGGVRDSRSDLCSVNILTGQDLVELDERIIKVVSAKTSDGRPLSVVGPRHHDALVKPVPGDLYSLIAGEDELTLRCMHIPTTDISVSLVVDRLPLDPLTEDSPLEVRREHVMELVPGMLALAYTKQDAETRDDKRAALFAAEFKALCDRAYLEKRRRSGNNRSVQYGGL